MRSKEVDRAINHLKDSYFDELEREITEKSVDTVLNYISEKEEENAELKAQVTRQINLWNKDIKTNYISKGKIRDKIKELEKHLKDVDYHDIKDTAERNFYKKEYMQTFMQIQILNNLLEGE